MQMQTFFGGVENLHELAKDKKEANKLVANDLLNIELKQVVCT